MPLLPAASCSFPLLTRVQWDGHKITTQLYPRPQFKQHRYVSIRLYYSLSTLAFLHVPKHRMLKATVWSPGSDVEQFQPGPPMFIYKNTFLLNLHSLAFRFPLPPPLNSSVPQEGIRKLSRQKAGPRGAAFTPSQVPTLGLTQFWVEPHLAPNQAWPDTNLPHPHHRFSPTNVPN